MKKMLCSLLTVLLLVSCFAGTVNAAERAMGKFDVTVKAGELKPAKTGFPMAAGETVTINATYSPGSADVDFGLVPEQETSHAGQAGAIFAPSTEFVSADAAGEYRYTKLPIEGYRVRSVFPASGNLVYVIATPCDASGRFLVGEDGVIPTQLIQYDLQTQQKTDFC